MQLEFIKLAKYAKIPHTGLFATLQLACIHELTALRASAGKRELFLYYAGFGSRMRSTAKKMVSPVVLAGRKLRIFSFSLPVFILLHLLNLDLL